MNTSSKLEKSWQILGSRLLKRDKHKKLNLRLQKQFLENCDTVERLIAFLSIHNVEVDNTLENLQLYTTMSSNEFMRLRNFQKEHSAWIKLCNFELDELARSSFWLQVTLVYFKDSDMDIATLAAGKANKTGRHIIEQGINCKTGKDSDYAVRRVLRSLCSVAARGRRVVFSDHPFGRSFWRMYWANVISLELIKELPNNTTSDIRNNMLEKVYKILATSKFYKVIIEEILSGHSFASHPTIFSGLVNFIAEFSNKDNGRKRITGEKLKPVLQQVSYLVKWKALEILPPSANADEIGAIYEQIHKQENEHKKNR